MARITWSTDPIRKLDNLKPSKSRSIQRTAIRKASTEVRKDLRAAVPVRTGALKRSLAIKIGTGKRSLSVYGVIGASRKYVGTQIYTSRKTGQAVFATPKYYINLLDKGTRHFRGRNFLGDTWSGGQSKYMATIKRECGEGYRKALGV